MHLMITGTIMEATNYVAPSISNTNNGTAQPLMNTFFMPIPSYVETLIRLTCDSRELALYEKNNTYFAIIRSETLKHHIKLKEEDYRDILLILNRLNVDEANILNELKKEKAIKKGETIGEKDLWNMREVNGLLGIEVNEE